MKSCIQCGAFTSEKYCPHCGQKQTIRRLTLSSFFHDFFSRVYGLDGAFPKTLLGLARQPALVAEEYIKGIRGKYVGPVGYYFLIFAIFLLAVQLSDYSLTDYLPKAEEFTDFFMGEIDAKQSNKEKDLALATKQSVFNNIQYVHVLLVPLTAFWLGIWFKKSKYNFLEITVFSFFIHAQAIIFNLLGFAFFVFTDWKSNSLVSVLSLIYHLWCFSLFFSGQVRFKSLAKGFFAYILANLSFMVLTSIIVVIVMMLSK